MQAVTRRQVDQAKRVLLAQRPSEDQTTKQNGSSLRRWERNAGRSFYRFHRRVNDDGRFRQRAWYFSTIFADPKAVDTVYVLNTGLFRSTDGGKTFELLLATHGDHHGLWIDPQNPARLINANDGGASVSTDAGHTWTTENNQPHGPVLPRRGGQRFSLSHPRRAAG